MEGTPDQPLPVGGPHDLAALAAQFDSLLEGAPFGVGIFDRDVRHVRVNPVLEQMNGRPAAELLGLTPSEVNGEVGRQAEELYRQVLTTGEAMRDVRLTGEVVARPGELRHWRVDFHPIRQGDAVIGLCVIVRDVTVEQQLTDALAASEQRNRHLAEDLQRDLLPLARPSLPGADVAAVYRPAMTAAAVGGDFYDVVDVGGGRWLLVIGDVEGKGPVAASLTAAVRYAIRAAAVVDPSPAAVLRTVNEVLLHRGSTDRLCTAACLLLERHGAAWSVRSASAGHPLPLVVRDDGSTERLGSFGMVLGIADPPPMVEATTTLNPRDCVVLYTDGVTEARAPGAHGPPALFGGDRLAAVATRARADGAEAVAAAVEREVIEHSGDGLADDLAVLVLRAQED